ncbi:MAG: hypothetical protein JOY51_00720 [Nevskia sp.]|nr:hypothetical protein [Nevskia sp.]
MMLNQRLYESLPIIYIGSGVLNALLLESPVKYLPSLLFIGAGVTVQSWRWRARNRAKVQARARERAERATAAHLERSAPK